LEQLRHVGGMVEGRGGGRFEAVIQCDERGAGVRGVGRARAALGGRAACRTKRAGGRAGGRVEARRRVEGVAGRADLQEPEEGEGDDQGRKDLVCVDGEMAG
jgi:hypothetical protein